MRLLTYLQQNHQLSRRKITALIDDEAVFLNKKLVEVYKIEVENGDKIEIKSSDPKLKTNLSTTVAIEETESKIIIFNKPVGYVVSKSDPHNKTIYTLLPAQYQNYYYLGRLDKESHGLLLLTNDPALVHERSHPSKGVEKEYKVALNRELDERDIKDCLYGIADDGELLRAINIEKIESTNDTDKPTYKVILVEGKKRHIRRMFMSLGYRIADLQRVREGKHKLGDLKLEETREIKEIK